MTNHWNDLANSDCILIMGSNPAENHPISFKWVLKAQDKGAKVVSVDPRFTHSSSKADFYVQLRVGTDIAFLGGMINYILNNDKYFKAVRHRQHQRPHGRRRAVRVQRRPLLRLQRRQEELR